MGVPRVRAPRVRAERGQLPAAAPLPSDEQGFGTYRGAVVLYAAALPVYFSYRWCCSIAWELEGVREYQAFVCACEVYGALCVLLLGVLRFRRPWASQQPLPPTTDGAESEMIFGGDDVRESQQAGAPLGNARAVLTPEDLMDCLREPWEKAFSAENVASAWKRDGIVPFTRKVYWDVRLEWEAREQRIAAVAGAAIAGPGHSNSAAPAGGGAGGQPHGRPARRRNAPAMRMATRAMRMVRPGRRTRMKMTTPRAPRDRCVADRLCAIL